MISYDRNLILLLGSNFLASVGIGVAMIAIPWLLATRSDGGVLFGVLMTASNVALAVVTPFIGVIIDRFSRKHLMVYLRLFFLIGLGIVYYLYVRADSETIGLILYYLLGASFYVVNIPLRTAFVQELYYDRDYSRVNSILEIENQAAAVAIGAIAIIAMQTFGLGPILILNAFALALAIWMLDSIFYTRQITSGTRLRATEELIEGFAIMKRRPALSLVLLVSTLPYVVVILYSYLHPVALGALDGASGADYAIVEILFAIGAMAAGWMLVVLPVSVQWLPRAIFWSVGLFSLIAMFQALLPVKLAFFAIGMLFGAFNSITRILRQTLLMRSMAPAEIGRIGAFLQSWIMILRAITLAAATGLVAEVSVSSALWLAALIPLLGWVCLLLQGCRAVFPLTSSSKEFHS